MGIGIPANRVIPFAGAFAVCHLTDKVNAGAKPPKYMSANYEHNVCDSAYIHPAYKVY